MLVIIFLYVKCKKNICSAKILLKHFSLGVKNFWLLNDIDRHSEIIKRAVIETRSQDPLPSKDKHTM